MVLVTAPKNIQMTTEKWKKRDDFNLSSCSRQMTIAGVERKKCLLYRAARCQRRSDGRYCRSFSQTMNRGFSLETNTLLYCRCM